MPASRRQSPASSCCRKGGRTSSYRDVILRKHYFQDYPRVSESAYARPRSVVPLTAIDLNDCGRREP